MVDYVDAGLSANSVSYSTALERQRALHADVATGRAPDTVLLLEHPSVYTAGKRTAPDERPDDGTPVVDVDRGGKITWHGPGQLVGYPIVRLGSPVDVVAHVRRLEEVMMAVCADLGVRTERVEGRSGVWLPAEQDRPERKIGAIGIRVSQDVTMHGFALNADCDLSWGQVIIPCGIADAGVTNLSLELGRRVTVGEIVPLAQRHLEAVLGAAVPTR